VSLGPFGLGNFGFLLFYAALVACTLFALRQWMRAAELQPTLPLPRLDDPYLIACLRDGPDEALRVATVSLADRGLLAFKDGRLVQQDERAAEVAKRDVEKAVLRAYREPAAVEAGARDDAARRACEAYRQQLERHGLLAGAQTFAQRLPKVVLALVVLLTVAGARVLQALSHGRHNVGFLVALAGVGLFLLWRMWRRRRTFAGDAALADLRTLFKRLKQRAGALRPGGASNEMALLIAVFGLAALPAQAFPVVQQLYPQPTAGSGGDSSSSSSSSSDGGSSDGGSSCGGGCGGGGCGGGD
jgi:uncharacterized protein (TIGR04222 family)